MKMKNLFFVLFSIILFSCSTPKDISYFQDMDKYMNQLSEIEANRPEFRIKSGDNLIITVSTSSNNQTSVSLFNLPMISYLSPGEAGEKQITQSPFLRTFPVDKDGNITYPVFGKINLLGKTKTEAIEFMTAKIEKHVDNPIVDIQLASFRVAVMGEVLQPASVEAKNEKLTVLEALSEAGDITIFGKRTNVLVIRENNGKKEYGRLDLTKAESLASPYYYLQQGDVIIVEPNDSKKRSSKVGTQESYMLNIISLSFSALTLLTSILTLTRK